MKIMNYKDGIRLYELMKNKGYNIRKIVFDKVTHLYLNGRYLDTYKNK